MRLEYNLSAQDYINFNLSYAETSPTVKKSMMRARITGPIMFLIMPFVMKNVSNIPFAYWMVLFSLTAIGWFFLMPYSIKRRTIKQVHQMLLEKGNNFLGHKVLELQPNGIMTKGMEDETLTSYKSVEDVTQYQGGVYIYTSSVSAIMISPEAFRSEAHRQEFLQELYAKINIKPKSQAKKSIFDKLDDL